MAITPEKREQKAEAGFALLIAVIFMSVMLAIGLALSSLSYKQQILSSTAIQSQYAFYVADAGLECALYADQQQNRFAYDAMNPPTSAPAITCDNSSPITATFTTSPTQMVVYNRISLDAGTHCADITVYKPATPGTTYIFSQGYDVPCSVVANPNGARFVARGINIQY